MKRKGIMPRDHLADETVSVPFGVFAVVDGRPIAFLGSASPISGLEAVDYAKAQRELLRQCIERLDRWIELATWEGLPKP